MRIAGRAARDYHYPMPSDPTDPTDPTGIIIVDHGSRRDQSNAMLESVVARYRTTSRHQIVEPAHMELAEPTIAQAFDRCVKQGATRIVVMPFFLLPGKHWDQDIPRLAQHAADAHPGISFLVTAPIGLDPMMLQVIEARIDRCLGHATGQLDACELCAGSDKCMMHGSDAGAQ